VRYGIDPDERKDCMQIIFTELFRSLKNFDSAKASFKTWMTRVLINQINNYKKKNKIKTIRIDDQKEDQFSLRQEEQTNHVDNKYILTVISSMPDHLLTVFNMAIIDGYSHQEIASELRITESASRVTLHRARQWAMERLKSLDHNTTNQKSAEQT
jgi:RNA polymerase sigma factor (sigma-70 family)